MVRHDTSKSEIWPRVFWPYRRLYRCGRCPSYRRWRRVAEADSDAAVARCRGRCVYEALGAV